MTTEPIASPRQPPAPASIKLVSHSLLFYWWPVWACGLVLGVLSLLDGHRLAILPEGSRLEAGIEGPQSTAYRLVVPGNREPTLPTAVKDADGESFPVRVATNAGTGMVFCAVLLVVIFSISVPLRGLWSVVVLLGLVIV